MAEKWSEAFGRYIRTLRERRGLSLQDVTSLSQPFAEPITKGYLSRCENGRVRLALSKVPALTHIYKVSAEVLLERIDLDMELSRLGAPDTVGMTRAELRDAGKRAANTGYKWIAYAYLRDCAIRAASEPVGNEYSDRNEQIACAVLGCATAALTLGRVRLALHEYQHVEANNLVGSRYLPLLLERLATAFRKLRELERARDYADRAIVAAEAAKDGTYLGYAYSARALQALAESDLETASTFFQRSHKIFRDTDQRPEWARSLSNLAQVYFDLGRYGAARRALVAAEIVLRPVGHHHRHQALIGILLGEIDALENRDSRAQRHWQEAAQIARELKDKTLQFKAEYQLLRHAHRRQDEAAVRAIQRRLSRLSNYVAADTPELQDFQELVTQPAASS